MIKKLLSATLALIMVFSVTTIAMPALADDGEDVYEEIFVYDSTVQPMSNSEVPEALLTVPEGETGELLRAVGKKVYVAQDYDEDGNVVGSHLMTNAEVRSSELIGEDDESFRGLTIFMQLFSSEMYPNEGYSIYGNAQWDESPNDIFSDGYDQMAISWGGNQAFKAQSQHCGGWYYNGSNFTGARNKSDMFTGYCWQFQEHNGFGWIERMQANVSLERVSSTVSGKETNAVLSYVHTYGEIVPSVSFNVGSSGINGGINLSTTVQNWKIEVDLGGLMY